MRVELTARHLVISPSLRSLVTRKSAKLERHLSDAGVSAAIVLFKEKLLHVVEITLHARGEQFLHAVAKGGTWATALTDAVAKVLHQADTVKGKWHERKRRGVAARSVKRPKAVRVAAASAETAAPSAAKRASRATSSPLRAARSRARR